MARKLRWTDVQDIAIELEERHPDADNVNLRFTDLHKWVLALEGFSDDPKNSNEKKLEAIQMAWHEEWQDRNS
jgi:FeS assembly protein IscX